MRRTYTPFQTFVILFLCAVGIGAVWEIFEYTSGLTSGEPGYWFDTLKDLGDDILGALVAWGVYFFLYARKDKTL
jgi:hypothetical protein